LYSLKGECVTLVMNLKISPQETPLEDGEEQVISQDAQTLFCHLEPQECKVAEELKVDFIHVFIMILMSDFYPKNLSLDLSTQHNR